MTFLIQQTLIFAVPLMIVALAGVFSERSGIINLALEGIMIFGAFAGVLFVNLMQQAHVFDAAKSAGNWLALQGFELLAMLVAAARKRWWLLGQLAVFAAVAFAAAKLLKPLLPRPLLVHVESSVNNSAPSGHTMLAAAAGLMLLAAVPRSWRACAAVLSTVFTSIVGVSVIYDRWHRPVDVVMSVCIAGACMMLALACTRASGMDRTGSRMSSPSVQIAATALITLGLCAIAYGAYVLWQVFPGLQYASAWAAPGACAAATAMVVGFAGLVNGMVLMMRQITAAPLTRLGLIGEPPAPPRKAAA